MSGPTTIADFVQLQANKQTSNQCKALFRTRLRQGAWWDHCQVLLTADDREMEAWCPRLPVPGTVALAALETWRTGLPIGRFFDPIGSEQAQRFLRAAAVQLHCVRIARSIHNSATADWSTFSPAGPLPPDQEAAIQTLTKGTAITAVQLRYWVLLLLRGEAGIQRQRINVLWVADDRSAASAGAAFLVFSLVPGTGAIAIAHPTLGFLGIDEDFLQAIDVGWQAVRDRLAREDRPWPANAGIAWRWVWRDEDPLDLIRGPSAGGAAAFAAYLLGRRASWTPSCADRSPLLDPEVTKGIGVSSRLDAEAEGAVFANVGGFDTGAKLLAALRSRTPHLHTLVVAENQPLAADLERRFISADGSAAVLEDAEKHLDYSLIRARDLRQALSLVESRLLVRWRGTRLYGETTEIREFLAEYLGTPGNPIPFGGRDAALQDLDDWFDHPTAPPRMLLTAPAGRGKSALVAQWIARFWTRDDTALLFLPVSNRFGTQRDQVIAEALLTRLRALHGQALPRTAEGTRETAERGAWGMSAQDHFAEAARLLGQPLPDGRTLLLVIDGLDEASDWSGLVKTLPRTPPEGLRVLVSARYLVEDRDDSGWLARLGWDPRSTRRPELPPLTSEGLADVLVRMGFPLAELGQRVDIVGELYRLTEGDPLLTRFYVDDLWKRGDAAARLQPEDLARISAGLNGYFEDWWEKQVPGGVADEVHAVHAVLAEALDAARAIAVERNRAHALAALAPSLPPDQRTAVLAEALAAARAISYEGDRACTLAALAPQCPPNRVPELIQAFRPALRESLLEILSADSATHLLAVGAPTTAEEIARAILDTCRWWP